MVCSSTEIQFVSLLRCPKFSVRCSLTKFRPLPRAQLAVSAAGGARIASQFHHARILPHDSIKHHHIRIRRHFIMGWGDCQSKVRPAAKPGPEILVLSTEFYKPVDKKSSNLYDFSLTFGLVTCKIDSVWCTLGQYGTKRFIDNRRFAGVCVLCPVWVFVLIR